MRAFENKRASDEANFRRYSELRFGCFKFDQIREIFVANTRYRVYLGNIFYGIFRVSFISVWPRTQFRIALVSNATAWSASQSPNLIATRFR